MDKPNEHKSLKDIFISNQDTDTHRVCGTCGKVKPLEAFYRDGKTVDGIERYRRDCKVCYKKTRIESDKMKAQRRGK